MATDKVQIPGEPPQGGREDGRALRMAALVLALLSLAPAAGVAQTREARIQVGATVLPEASLIAEQRPAFIEVGAADLARGFVELPGALRLVVRNTSPTGFALDVSPTAPVFAGLEVEGAGSEVLLPAEGGAITLRGARGRAELDLSLRLALVPGLAPGRYPWPVRLTVRPL